MKLIIVFLFALFSLANGAMAQTEVQIPPSARLGVPVSGIECPGDLVTGAPYFAEQVTESVQTLADGNHITRPGEKLMFYRDSQGRTRIERTLPLPQSAIVQSTFINIDDPVRGTHYTLNTRLHTATPVPCSAPRHGVMGTIPASPQVAPAKASTSANQSQEPQVSHESLATENIEGILAEGTRTTRVDPVGTVGNDRPITIIHEIWTSPELKVVVLSKDSNPLIGDSTTWLINISRAEPDAGLFQVPPDYQTFDDHTSQSR